MRVLVACLGSAGDVLPFVSLGSELKRRGHHVSLLTNPHFRPLAEKTGLDFGELGSEEDYRKALEDPELYDSRHAWRTLLRVAVLPALKSAYRFIEERHVPGSTLVIASRFVLGARIAQERWGIPTASVVLTPYALRSARRIPAFLKRLMYRVVDRRIDAILAPELNAFRKELGLPSIRRIFDRWLFSPDHVIALFPEWYAAPQPDWPKPMDLVGFPLFDGGEETMSSTLEDFLAQGTPPVVFTAGTAMHHADHFFHESVRACQLAGHRGLFVTSFPEQIPRDLPAGFLHVSIAPFSVLFRRVSAVVHSGGIGTVAQALAAGIPQMIVPLAYDQFDNAARLTRLGVALTLHRKKYSSTPVARGLQQLLKNPSFKQACAVSARRLEGNRSIQDACDIIESNFSR